MFVGFITGIVHRTEIPYYHTFCGLKFVLSPHWREEKKIKSFSNILSNQMTLEF